MTETKEEKQIVKNEIIASPKTPSCNDVKCAIHGALKTRGRVFEGVVVSDKMQKTITVEWPRLNYIPKYERYEKRRSKVKAHSPVCMSAKTGNKVRIAECRPLAKTVKFVVVEVLG